jgi:DNA-binding MarR family transcriptional regulator
MSMGARSGGIKGDVGTLSLEEILPIFNRMFWWSGVRPMFRRMVEADLTMAESVVLRSLQRGPLTVAEAASCLMLSHSAASRAVDRLVRDGYIEREENPEDRRQKLLTLAPKGADLVQEMEGIAVDGLRQLTATLSPEECETMRALLVRMITSHISAVHDKRRDEDWGRVALVPAGAFTKEAR